MKLTARIRKLPTPLTNRHGRPLTNAAGEPLHTQYIEVSADKHFALIRHMRNWMDKIALGMTEMGIEDFAEGAGIDVDMRSQINNEPRAYSWIERFEIVYERLQDNHSKQMSTGIIDMYNMVVCSVYLHSGFPNDLLEYIRVDLEDPALGKLRSYLNPDLFS